MKYDVIIIGAGVSGCAVARELAKTDLRIMVLEKEEDVCEGTSKANSGIVHAGYDAMPGTLKAKLNVRGNEMMARLSEELAFDFIRNGSLVLCFDERGRKQIEELYERGKANKVPDLEIWERERILEEEPNVNEEVVCALHAPTAGIVCPFGMNIALAENAADNGVQFVFNERAEHFERTQNGWKINGKYDSEIVINAAGVYAGHVHDAVSKEKIEIRPRKGEYFLLDHEAKGLASHTLFQLPGPYGKGVLIAPTVHENILVGPTADFTDNFEETNTTMPGLERIRSLAANTIRNIPYHSVITSFAGLRAVGNTKDFIIQESVPGWIDVAAIESPGLTSAPAIGEMVAEMVRKRLHPEKKVDFVSKRKGFVNVKKLSKEEWDELIEKDKAYGKIVCRCEMVTEGQVRDACNRSVPASSTDGIKRRVRAGMGRCQGGFCLPRVMEIVAECTDGSMEKVQKAGAESVYITGKNKEDLDGVR